MDFGVTQFWDLKLGFRGLDGIRILRLIWSWMTGLMKDCSCPEVGGFAFEVLNARAWGYLKVFPVPSTGTLEFYNPLVIPINPTGP